jgi:hypothetical protein
LIPKSIQQTAVMAALQQIDQTGVPAGRQSRKFHLLHGGKQYPPKYVLTLACKFQTGHELQAGTFNGGHESNDFLRGLGFVIFPGVQSQPKASPASPKRTTQKTPPSVAPVTVPRVAVRHTERCKDCKTAVERLLAKLYGGVERNPKIDVPANTDEYEPAYRPSLQKVFSALQSMRGFTSFVRSDSLPRCDFLVPSANVLVEFDESQHFTKCRLTALSNYPESLPLGFDRLTWMRLCDEINAHDDTPPFRDEQRAWYDALRDFLVLTKSMRATIRLWAEEQRWCKFDAENPEDLESFRQVLGDRASFWGIDFDIPGEPFLGRIAIDGNWRGEMVLARKLLRDISAKWPIESRVLSLSTCGAFLRIPWPNDVKEQSSNFNPSPEAVRQLEVSGRAACEALLSNGVREALATHADYLTIGVDTAKDQISKTGNPIHEAHAELVYVADLRTGHLHFTGKSYPTVDQEQGLIRISDLNSHFVQMDGHLAVVLGCHDLTIFNRRSDSRAKRVERVEVKEQFKRLCDLKKPTIVLHHPHTTIKVSTWRDAWGGVAVRVPTVRSYLGTGCYSYKDDWGNRHGRSVVLSKTKSQDVMDIVVQMAGIPS